MPSDLDFLQDAYAIARQHSDDPSTQNGAILVVDGKMVAWGANTFPHGVEETAERWDRPLKYSYVEHAERNCLYMAARLGKSTMGATMYCPWFACTDCARAIIQCCIKEVIGHDFELHKTSSRWLEEIKIADQMLKEAGIKFRRIPGKIGGSQIRFNGVLVEP